jgi:hypothetical protein
MNLRFPSLLPRVALIAAVALGATATLTYAAGQGISTATPPTTQAPVVRTQIVVPDVRNQAFVFAKGALEDAGFAWKVIGSVHGYSSNTVVAQTPRPGTKLFDTGSPLVKLSLARNSKYPQVGAADDVAPYSATAVDPVYGPAFPAPVVPKRKAAAVKVPVTTTTPAATTTAPTATATTTTTTTETVTAARATAVAPAVPAVHARTPDFIVPGAKREPADEIPLTLRATRLDAWLTKHPQPTNANVKYWLYQQSWLVTGAKLGWWHGADALRKLIAVDTRVQAMWGMGRKSHADAVAALRYVAAQAKK